MKQDSSADHTKLNFSNIEAQRGKGTCPGPHSKFKAQLELEFKPPASCSKDLAGYVCLSPQPGQSPSRVKTVSNSRLTSWLQTLRAKENFTQNSFSALSLKWLLLKMTVPSKGKHTLPKNNNTTCSMPNIYMCVCTHTSTHTHKTPL